MSRYVKYEVYNIANKACTSQTLNVRTSSRIGQTKMSLFRFGNMLRPIVSEIGFCNSMRTISSFKVLFSKSSISPKLFLESGEIDSDSEELQSPKVKKVDHTLITVPVRLKKRLEKKLIKESTEYFQRQKIRIASRLGNKTRIIIHCKQQKFNHYYGQTYARDSEIPLASKGWTSRKAVEDFFTIKPHNQQLSAFDLNDEKSSFENLGLNSDIAEAIRNSGILQPTHIQSFAIPQLLGRNNCLLAAETGCGKTFAYLFPLIQQILEKKAKQSYRKVNQPYAIVLVPSRELADQVYNVASKYCDPLQIKVRLLQGGHVGAKIKDPTSSVVDLLIATASVAKALISIRVLDPKEVEHIVLDEADTLLDDSFSNIVIEFLRNFKFVNDNVGDTIPAQITLVSATLPRSVDSILEEVVPVDSLHRITTPNLHRILSHVPQTFLRLKKIQKPEKILDILKKDMEKQVPVMIFCNKNETCDWMQHHLHNNDIDCISLHGKKFVKFRKSFESDFQSGKINIITCTDLASRGLDTLRTGHVVNYEFPNFLSDYIHRCGRTGRIGSTVDGKVTNFIAKPHEVELVQEIEKSVRKEISLDKVNANIKRILNARYGMYKQILPPNDDEK